MQPGDAIQSAVPWTSRTGHSIRRMPRGTSSSSAHTRVRQKSRASAKPSRAPRTSSAVLAEGRAFSDRFGSGEGGMAGTVGGSLRLTQGDGTLPTEATTNADGLAQVYYTAGRRNGVVQIAANVGDFSAAATLVQAPPNVVVPALPTSGSGVPTRLPQRAQKRSTPTW